MANRQLTAPTTSFPSPSIITTIYRQNVSNFLSYSDACLRENPQNNNHDPDDKHSSWIGDTARSLALRAASTPSSSDDAATINNAHQNAKKASAAKKMKSNARANNNFVSAGDTIGALLPPNWSDFICMACGTFLFPPVMPAGSTADDGNASAKSLTNLPLSIQSSSQTSSSSSSSLPSNIYLRPLKRGRTRRRRASRSKAKQLHNRSLSLQRRGGSVSSNTSIQLRQDELIKEEMQRIASSYCMGDGRAKNCLVMKCTYCGTKQKRKGVEVRSQKRKSEAEARDSNAAGGGGQRMRRDDKKQQQQPESVSSRGDRKNVSSQIRENSDFISLGGLTTTATTVRGGMLGLHGKRKQDDGSDRAFSSPLLAGGKKKKKKKKSLTTTKKGGLSDFLSSLND